MTWSVAAASNMESDSGGHSGKSSPNTDAMNFNDQQAAAILRHIRVRVKVRQQPLHQLIDYFRVIVKLDGNDAVKFRGWIAHDVHEIAVEREQDTAKLLCLCDH